MSKTIQLIAAVILMCVASLAFAEIYSIPENQLDPKKLYWGAPAGFEKAGEVDYDTIVKATPEYKELKAKKIERGTGKYWILMSQASDRSARAICQVGQDTDFDLIAAEGYLGSLKPAIPAEDITKLILEQIEEPKTKTSK